MSTQAELKKKLDKVFSLYIRLRCADEDGFVNCFTCDKRIHYKQAHAGHYIPRNILITRFDERNLKPQCVGCNLFGNGKPLDFEERLKREIGEKEVEAMKASRHKVFKIDSIWYQEQIDKYKQLIKKLSID